ncbi:phosphoglucosamine mutase [Aminiphilus circumscriptus]|uniref:phosphoglucosamine mutase n=1 Tax=Aminiphilus circumscriptus TaxID=290732 RepID=UPI0004927D51|nr:phosphoglucosamine mutase [Aminiphilus circumscriptus]
MLTASGKVRCLFGTDGVRDVANRGAMTPEMAMSLSRAYVWWLTQNGFARPHVIVGRDTRRSGSMLEAAVLAGLTSAGAEASVAGILPTPGVSFAIRSQRVQGGAVISASHNPAEYNGLKFFDKNGFKLSDDDEATIEEFLEDHLLDQWRPTGASVGEITHESERYGDAYVEWLVSLANGINVSGASPLVLDCAHGAAFAVAEEFVRRCRLPVTLVGAKPDGLNINDGVGVMYLPHLAESVKEKGAALGIALDGDADRVLLVDKFGRTIDGDILLWVLARWLKAKNSLGAGVVATVMSNMALEEHLALEGIPVFRCPVGDKYVVETMRYQRSALGGEQSGHIISGEHVSTGDGLCTGILFLHAISELGEDVSSLVDRFDRYPQLLKNVKVRDKKKTMEDARLQDVLSQAERKLRGLGRVFVRSSGTEPFVRILVEAKEKGMLEDICIGVEQVIRHIDSLE